LLSRRSRRGVAAFDERPHDECAAREFSAAMCASVAGTSVVSGARRTPYDSMEASQWKVD